MLLRYIRLRNIKYYSDHVRKKNFEKQYEEIGGILHVVSEVCLIPGINSLGSIAQVNIFMPF